MKVVEWRLRIGLRSVGREGSRWTATGDGSGPFVGVIIMEQAHIIIIDPAVDFYRLILMMKILIIIKRLITIILE